MFARWASRREGLIAGGLVGSHARGEARPDSDVDLVVIVADPGALRETSDWVGEIEWSAVGLEVQGWHDKDYGILWSRHTQMANGLEVEIGFAPPLWASVDPPDEGTLEVVRNGFRIVYDPSGLLNKLRDAI